jgi:hypothetical protein
VSWSSAFPAGPFLHIDPRTAKGYTRRLL